MPTRRRVPISPEEILTIIGERGFIPLTLSDATRVLSYLTDRGILTTLDEPWSFSLWLCQALSDPVLAILMFDMFQIKAKDFFRITCPEGVWVARGYHTLPVTNARDVCDIVFSSPEDERGRSSYSLNIAYAAGWFARPLPRAADFIIPHLFPSRKHDDPIRAYLAERWRPIVSKWLAAQGLPFTPSNAAKAIAYNDVAVLAVTHLGHDQITGFGGDSESGFLNEAEVYVRTQPQSAMKKIFALAPFKLDAPLATEKERKVYCLSYHDVSIIDARAASTSNWHSFRNDHAILLHALSRGCVDSPFIKKVREYRTPAEALAPKHQNGFVLQGPPAPERYRWYRVFG